MSQLSRYVYLEIVPQYVDLFSASNYTKHLLSWLHSSFSKELYWIEIVYSCIGI